MKYLIIFTFAFLVNLGLLYQIQYHIGIEPNLIANSLASIVSGIIGLFVWFGMDTVLDRPKAKK